MMFIRLRRINPVNQKDILCYRKKILLDSYDATLYSRYKIEAE